MIQVRKTNKICAHNVTKFFKKKQKTKIFTAKNHFFPKTSVLAFFSLEKHTGITFCETRVPIVDSNWRHRVQNEKSENERHQNFEFEKWSYQLHQTPKTTLKSKNMVFFEILCLFEFVCFQSCHFLVQNVICGFDLLGIYKISRFRCYMSKKRIILVLPVRPWNFNVKTRRWRKMTRHSLEMPLKLLCFQEFSYNFSRWCKGHMWFKLERGKLFVSPSWQKFSKKKQKKIILLSKHTFLQKCHF